MSVYAGTTLIEAQEIVEGDYSTFDWRERVNYRKVYLNMNPAVRDGENALDNDEDKPVVVALLSNQRKCPSKTVSDVSAPSKPHESYRTKNF